MVSWSYEQRQALQYAFMDIMEEHERLDALGIEDEVQEAFIKGLAVAADLVRTAWREGPIANI